jgi:hypothetical protein
MNTREADLDGVRGCIVHTASISALEGQISQGIWHCLSCRF